MNNKILGVIIVLVAIASFLGGTTFTKWQAQKGEITSAQQAPPSPAAQRPTQPQEVTEGLPKTIGAFSVLEEDICQEDDKPIIYFFGSQSCPHCTWEHPIFEKVVENFSDLITVHNNMDSDADGEVFQRYLQINHGSIPFLLLGCQYARVGSGENYGEEQEEKFLTALLCQLTDGQPGTVCAEVEDLIEQIED